MEQLKYAICVDNFGKEEELTVGKSYRIDGKGVCSIFIQRNNKGVPAGYRLDRFEFEDAEQSTTVPTKNTLSSRKTTLPTDSAARKNVPMFSGCLRYFPAALAGVSNISKLGNDKHNPGEEMHHARGKSTDQGDCIIRHLVDVEDLKAAIDRGDTTVTSQDVLLEINQLVWRALAFSQELHEKFGAPLAPGAKLPTGGKNGT